MRALRLIADSPLAQGLNLNVQWNSTTSGAYQIALLENIGIDEERDLLARCRTFMASGLSIGMSPVALPIRAVFFDMDSTVIAEESIVELARAAEKEREVSMITEQAMAGELDFAEALRARVAMLKGLPASIIDEVGSRLTLNPGIQDFAAFCRDVKVPIFLVSGGFHDLAANITRRVGFAGFRANRLGILSQLGSDVLTGTIDGDIVDGIAKRNFMLETCKKLGIDPGQCAAVGDGANDLPMLQCAGVAVGYRPKSVLLPHIHAANMTGNHRFLAPLFFGRDLHRQRSRGVYD